MDNQAEEMVNIWRLVGYILLLYGGIITACGIYYSINGAPPTTMGEMNASLWWGILMVISGIIFFYLGRSIKIEK